MNTIIWTHRIISRSTNHYLIYISIYIVCIQVGIICASNGTKHFYASLGIYSLIFNICQKENWNKIRIFFVENIRDSMILKTNSQYLVCLGYRREQKYLSGIEEGTGATDMGEQNSFPTLQLSSSHCLHARWIVRMSLERRHRLVFDASRWQA